MKKIIYSRPDGGLSVVAPLEGSRLAFFIRLADGTALPSGVAPFFERPVDSILRRWPIAGASAEWAESEAAFVARIAESDVFVTITDSPDAVRSKMGVDLPADVAAPAMMLQRNADSYGIGYTRTPYLIVDESEIPKDRTYRNAWKADGRAIVHDMPKCVEIHKNRMRQARAGRFVELDIRFMKALEEPSTEGERAEIVSLKRELRDVTRDPRINEAQTPEDLTAVWPECLS